MLAQKLWGVALLTFVIVAPGAAQDIGAQADAGASAATRRGGFWFTGGLGFGSATVSFQGASESEGGGTSAIGLGGTVASGKLQLGGMFTAWFKNNQGLDQQMGGVYFVATFYPSRTGNFWLRAGLGFSVLSIDDDIDELSISNVGSLIGVGYDIVVGKIGLTPFLHFAYQPESPVSLNGQEISGSPRIDASLVQLGIAISVP